jgi:hypothetical protein
VRWSRHGVAAMRQRRVRKTRVAAGIVGHADMMLGSRSSRS